MGEVSRNPVNRSVAAKLREAAELLAQQSANPFRVGAYRRAADSVDALERDIGEVLAHGGEKELTKLPGVGRGIAAAIREIVSTGRWSFLERLRGSLDAVRLFQTIPGVGPTLAERIHDELGVDTLEALESAAHDGSLEEVEGVGRRRAEAIRAALASMLGRIRVPRGGKGCRPPVEMILDVDREYREKAGAGKLPKIAPRRFNPRGERWLPILHTHRGRWHFTVLFSNTARAHELGRTRDWVVVYYYDDHHEEGQCTVVTETRGALKGRRVVRGREAECAALAAPQASATP